MAHPIDHSSAALLRSPASTAPPDVRWWQELGGVTIQAANVEWLVQRLLWCEAGLTARTSAVVLPGEFASTAALAARLIETAIPHPYRQLVFEWIEQAQIAMDQRDRLIRGCWLGPADGAPPQRLRDIPASSLSSPSTVQPSAAEVAGVSAALHEVSIRGVELFAVLAGIERHFADLGFDEPDDFQLASLPSGNDERHSSGGANGKADQDVLAS